MFIELKLLIKKHLIKNILIRNYNQAMFYVFLVSCISEVLYILLFR